MNSHINYITGNFDCVDDIPDNQQIELRLDAVLSLLYPDYFCCGDSVTDFLIENCIYILGACNDLRHSKCAEIIKKYEELYDEISL